MRRVLGTVAIALGLTAAGSARAADAAERAKQLFEQALELEKAGQAEKACPLFKEAVELEPNAVGGIFHLAQCYEEIGRLASAAAEYERGERAAKVAGQVERAKYARDQLDGLSARLARITIHVPAESRKAAPGLTIKRDDEPVPESLWDAPQPVDAGAHRLSATAPGRGEWQATWTARDGEQRTVEIPALDAAGAGAAPIWAWAVGGVGLALGAVAIGFAVDQSRAQATVHDHCPNLPEPPCDRSDGFDPAAVNRRLDRDFGIAVSFGVLGVGALTAGVVGLVLPRVQSSAVAGGSGRLVPWIGARASGLSYTISFE